MATGTVKYWNGTSGWIKQPEDTAGAVDLMVLAADVVDLSTMAEGVDVTFTVGSCELPTGLSDSWRAREVTLA